MPAIAVLACNSGGGSDAGSDDVSGTADTGTSIGSIGETANSSGTSQSTQGVDSSGTGVSATGILFDVGNAETGGDTDTGGIGLGSCRMSEIHGAAGGFPAFTDPAYAPFLGKSVLIMTSDDRVSPDDPVLRVFDISGAPPPPNMNYAAPMYIDPSWTAPNFGGNVFGLTLDSDGNIYVASTSIYGVNSTAPGRIYKVNGVTGAISTLIDLPNDGPAIGNINYDCVSETIYASNHEDCRIYQIDLSGTIRSTYHHGTGDVTMGPPADPGEPDGTFCPLGDRVWAVQSHYGRLYYGVWWEDSGRKSDTEDNEIWSVAYVDDDGVPDPATAELEATIPGLGGATYSNPVSDLSFAATGWMLAAERTMSQDANTSAHQSTTYELQQMNGDWYVVGETYVVGELPNSSAGGVDHDFAEDGYVWVTGDALDFYTDDVVYGVQGIPYGGGDITNSTLIDHDGDIASQFKTDLGDCEIPIPGDATPPPPPPEG